MLKSKIKLIDCLKCESFINNFIEDIYKKGYTFKDLKIVPCENNKLVMVTILYDDNTKCKHKDKITKKQAKNLKDSIYDSRTPLCIRNHFIDILKNSEVIDDDKIDIKRLLDETPKPTMSVVREKS